MRSGALTHTCMGFAVTQPGHMPIELQLVLGGVKAHAPAHSVFDAVSQNSRCYELTHPADALELMLKRRWHRLVSSHGTETSGWH